MAGKDFCIVAGDTRMSSGFSIKSRNVSKIYKLCAAAPTLRLRTQPHGLRALRSLSASQPRPASVPSMLSLLLRPTWCGAGAADHCASEAFELHGGRPSGLCPTPSANPNPNPTLTLAL